MVTVSALAEELSLQRNASLVPSVLVVVIVVELPEQIEFAPVIVGVVGNGLITTFIGALGAEVQPVTVFLILKV